MSLSVRNHFGQRNAAAGTGIENKPVAGGVKKAVLTTGGAGVLTRSSVVQRSVLGDINSRVRQPGAANGKNVGMLKKPVVGARKPLTRINKNTTVTAPTHSLQKVEKSGSTASSEAKSESSEFSHQAEQVKLQAYSTGLLPVVDIDAGETDPHLVSEYTSDIYLYLRSLEDRFSVRVDHLAGGCITGKMREVLVDWLVQVHLKFKLLPETLYLTVAVLDRFLQDEPSLPPSELQLAGVTAMWVACKYEEIYAPEVNDFVLIADQSFSAEQMRAMERRVLRVLDFQPGRPLPLHFLRRCSKAGGVDSRQHALAKYLMELSLQEYRLAHVAVSRLAAAALCLSLQVLTDEQTTEWNDQMVCYSFYRREQLHPLVCQLAALVVTAAEKLKDPRAKRAVVARKYANKKYLCISTMPELSSSIVRELAAQATDPCDL